MPSARATLAVQAKIAEATARSSAGVQWITMLGASGNGCRSPCSHGASVPASLLGTNQLGQLKSASTRRFVELDAALSSILQRDLRAERPLLGIERRYAAAKG